MKVGAIKHLAEPARGARALEDPLRGGPAIKRFFLPARHVKPNRRMVS